MADRGTTLYGLHAAESVVAHRIGAIRSAVVQEGRANPRLAAIVGALEKAGVRVERAHRSALDRRAGGGVHQGVVLRVEPPAPIDLNTFEALVTERGRELRLLVLDQVEDPRNLGACLRSADAAGADAVVVPKSRSAGLGPGALKSAAGAAETVPLAVVPNLARVLRWLADAGVRLVGADAGSERSLFSADLTSPVALVLGAEGRGLRRLTREACDDVVSIPMRGQVASLNVSVAAGILLFESLRQSENGV